MDNEFQIDKQILSIQWTNVRYYWDKSGQAVAQMTVLPFVVLFSKLLPKTTLTGWAHCAVKLVLSLAVLSFGVLVFLTLENYYQRSLRAREVIVAIETKWGLYRDGGLFANQRESDSFRYRAFAHEGERRPSQQKIQIFYAAIVATLSLAAAIFLF